MTNVFIPPTQSVAGLTQAQWGDQWWKYAFSIPTDLNPLTDTTGENANVGQSGSVFFLSGTLNPTPGNAVVRNIALPTNKQIFFPLVNFLDNTFGEVPPRTPQAVYDAVNAFVDKVPVNSLFAKVGAAAAPDLSKNRQTSPAPFDLTLLDGNLFGLPGGTIIPTSVSGGYWVMLNSLPARTEPYVINFGGTTDASSGSSLNITYVISTYNQVIGGNGKEQLVGTALNDEMYGKNGNDVLTGLGASDALDGGDGADTLIGVNCKAANPGLKEIDALTGGNGPDRFVLGDRNTSYYNDRNPNTQGLGDYALITDFKNSDTIQLRGSASDYVLVNNFRLGITTGTAIFLKDTVNELVGIAEGASGLTLNSKAFSFV
jgi:RTX calcium-binding nonapeptide repeat (4 copies)